MYKKGSFYLGFKVERAYAPMPSPVSLVMPYQIMVSTCYGTMIEIKNTKFQKFESFTSTPQISSAMRGNLLRQASLIEISLIMILNMLLQHPFKLI